MRRRSFRPMLDSLDYRITPTDLLPGTAPTIICEPNIPPVDTMPDIVIIQDSTEYGSTGDGIIAVTQITDPAAAAA